jgi:hypothetical protein
MADDTDLAHKPYRYRHGWIKLVAENLKPGKLEAIDPYEPGWDRDKKADKAARKAAKQTADVDLLHKVRSGKANTAEKRELARRGGATYLDLPPREYVKAEKDQDKSKADPARAEALYQKGQETARARAARRKGGNQPPAKAPDEATVRAKRVAARLYRNSPEGKRLQAKQDMRHGTGPRPWEPSGTLSQKQSGGGTKGLSREAEARERVRSMSDNQVRDFVEMGEQGKIDGALAKAAVEEHHRRRHHVPEFPEALSVKAEGAKAEKEARVDYYALRAKYGSRDPRVEAAEKKWQRIRNMNGGPTSQGEGDFFGAAHSHPSHDAIKRYEHGLGFSSPEGNDMDLAKYTPGPRPLVRAKRSFRKATGLRSLKTAAAKQVLANRAAKPGHFRAKAILAAQNGNTKAAKRLLAKSAAARTARRTGSTLVKPNSHPARPAVYSAAPRPAKSPKGKRVPKPGIRGPR